MYAIYCNVWIFLKSNYAKSCTQSHAFVNIFFNSLHKSVFNKACIAIHALLNQENPTLYKLNLASGNIKKQSHEQNTRRLLDSQLIDFKTFATSVFSSFHLKSDVTLTIDLTNYKFGAIAINCLVLSFVYKDTSIPIYWQMLDNNSGSSNSTQRIELVSWFLANFSNISIKPIKIKTIKDNGKQRVTK